MTNPEEILDQLRHKKALRIGILILGTLLITSAGALVYAGMTYEKALDVRTNGVSTGSGSTAPTGVSFSPPTILILAVSVFMISLSMFVFLREAHRHIRKSSDQRGFLPAGLGSKGLGEAEWEESPRKEEESSAP